MTDKEHDQAQLLDNKPELQAAVPDSLPAEPVAEADVTSDVVQSLPGDILAARRNELRLSIEEVCSRVKLAPRQIVALETNDYGALPGMATVRGFIRSYAKLLGLDPEPLLAAVAGEANPAAGSIVVRRPLPAPAFSGRRYSPPVSHRRGSRRLSGLAAVVLVFVGTLGFIAYQNGWLQVPAAFNLADADDSVPGLVESRPVATVIPTGAAEPAGDTNAVPTATPPVSGEADVLRLVLREDAWVEVTTIDGELKLVSRLMKAGTSETLELTQPVSLVVGNAAGVDASLRGQPLNLKAVSRDNVAKLNLK